MTKTKIIQETEIESAIRHLGELHRCTHYPTPAHGKALQLGIEALLRMKLIRKLESEKGKYRFGFLLPSEEEQCQK